MYRTLLQSIGKKMKGYGLESQQPCSLANLKKLRSKTKKELHGSIPEEYAEFLRLTDGLDWNGLQIYASYRSLISGYSDRFIEGFVDGNLGYRGFEPLSEFLIFADDGTVLFVYNIPQHEYQVILSVGLTVLETAASFEELIAKALQAHL